MHEPTDPEEYNQLYLERKSIARNFYNARLGAINRVLKGTNIPEWNP